ncbi:MAG TPA: ATP-binding protein [Candidatus Saccharimonadales bacterium]|nr:ATP-binding protein [Candidatus Saccharimonadales bacterium]
MLSESLIYIPCILGVFSIGLFVFTRSKQTAFRMYSLFSLILGIWLTLEFFIDAHLGNATWVLRFVSFLTMVMALTFIFFAYSYPNHALLARKKTLLLGIPLLLFLPVTFTDLVVKIASYQDKALNFVAGPLFTLDSVISVMYMLLGIIVLLGRVRKVDAVQRSQIYLMIIAFAFALTGNVFAGFIFADSQYWQVMRPLSIFAMLIIIAYAMVYRKLFDIRSYVVRAVAYAVALALVGLLFVLAAVVPTNYVLKDHLANGTALYLMLVMLLLAFYFERVKKYFNKLTSKIFFHDYYESQDFFNKLNDLLVATIDLKDLLNGTISIVEETLKTSYCMIVLRREGSEPYIFTNGASVKNITRHDFETVHSKISNDKATLPQVVVADYLGTENKALQRIMVRYEMEIMAQLGGASGGQPLIGHIIIGAKKTGSPYTNQDISIIEAMSNELTIAIQNALRFEEIEKFNITLKKEIEHATLQLRRTNDKLRKMDQTKDDFISMASHQLRTPLTSVKGYVSMVLDGDVGDLNRKQRDYLNQVFVSSQRMSYLISDLLNVSRLRTGKFIIDRNPCNLANVIHEEVSQLIETAKARELQLIYHQPEHFPTLMLDEMKMRQVIMNFIDNAIYYTPTGGSITVTLADNPQSIEFTVADTGIGVPRSEQHHLFSKFFRAQNARVARPDGTGLGLFMAKKVVTAQGGAIIFKSREGKGSTFGFTMPKTAVSMSQSGPKKVILHS